MTLCDAPPSVQALTQTLEALVFAAAAPVTRAQLRQAVLRVYGEPADATPTPPTAANDAESPAEASPTPTPPTRQIVGERFEAALTQMQARWVDHDGGFVLLEVAEGLAFRTHPRYGDVLRALRQEKPQRLSRPALETLAIVAYRQPATKPEVDAIRGVDSGGTLKVLLDRELVRIVGKREEAGRPLCYGTTKEFLNLFCLPSLGDLPSLRDMVELQDESLATMKKELGQSIEELAAQAVPLASADAEPAIEALHEAVQRLQRTENAARDQLAEQGVVLVDAQAQEAARPDDADGTDASLKRLAAKQRRRSAS